MQLELELGSERGLLAIAPVVLVAKAQLELEQGSALGLPAIALVELIAKMPKPQLRLLLGGAFPAVVRPSGCVQETQLPPSKVFRVGCWFPVS